MNGQESKRFDVYKLVNYMSKVNYIWYCLVGTVAFWIVNLPLALCLVMLPLNLTSLPFLVVAALPVGPGLQSLLKALKQVEITGKVWRPFFEAIHRDTKKLLKVWLPALVILGLAAANLLLSQQLGMSGVLQLVNLFILVAVVTFFLNFLLLNTFFNHVPLGNGLVTTAKLSLLKSGRYAMSFMMVLGVFILMSNLSIYLFFFGIGLAALLLIMNYRPIAEFIEEQTAVNN